MARPRRRVNFKPFRMGERFRNTILVGLGVFLMCIFAVPFQGSCQRERAGGRSPNDIFVTFDGTRIRYGQIMETRRLCHLIFRQTLTDEEAALRLAEVQEAERSGIRVSDAEMEDAVRNQIFPRRLKVEYAIAENGAYGKDLSVTDKEIEDAYRQEKDKRFQKADKTYRPLDEVREQILTELRGKKAGPLAKAAADGLKKAVDALVGAPLENAFKQLAPEHKLRFGETRLFSTRTARSELRSIGDAPGIADLVFDRPIGQPTEPLPLAGGWCVARVVSRSRGFGPDGAFYPEEEGWVRQGFGVINQKSYDEVLAEMGVNQADVESLVRQDLMLVVLPSLIAGSSADLPLAALRARYLHDNTQAVPAYFAVRATDFAQGISPTDEELRDFFGRNRDRLPGENQIGYRQPERVSIEYVASRTADVAGKLTEGELQKYFERNRAFFGPSFKDAVEDVRKRLAEEKLQGLITNMANRAADEATGGREPKLSALVAAEARDLPGAFEVRTTPAFASTEFEQVAPQLRGAKLAELLFGERGQQYAVADTEPKPGTHPHVISEVFNCEAGRFFFRVLKRIPGQVLQYDALPAELRTQLVRDVINDKAFKTAKEKAEEYRAKIYQAAFERFAERVGTKPLDTEFLKPKDTLPAVGQAVPEVFDQLARGEVGGMSDLVEVGDRFVLARLAAREEVKGYRLQLVTFAKQDLKVACVPALYEMRAAYDADPHAYLDKPAAIPFETAQGDIVKLLARRQAIQMATERADKALGDLAGTQKPDLAAVAAKHGLTVTSGVKVDLADTEATPRIGRAAGFREAVTALKPGEASRVVASSEGRFVFLTRSRDEKSATIDVAAALYDAIRADVKIEDKQAQQYYDEHRDTAYTAGNEIKEAPAWDAASAAVHDRVRQGVQDAWAKKPLHDRLTELRDSLVQEAFRTVPASTPIITKRDVPLNVETIGPFSLSKPEAPLATEPAALAAIRALKPGDVTKPLPTRDGALIALLAERKPGGTARAKVAVFRATDFANDVAQPSDDAIQKHYEANKEAFRVPEQATVDYLFAETAVWLGTVQPQLTDAECRRYFEERSDNEYRGMSFEEIEYRVRADLARERATAEARGAAERAVAAVKKAAKPAEADFAAIAKQLNLAAGKSEPFDVHGSADVPSFGRLRDVADDLKPVKEGGLLPRVLQTSRGFIVGRLVARTAPRLPELKEVRAQVARALLLQASRETARKAAAAFRAAAAASSFDKAAAQEARAPRVVETALVDAREFTVPGEGPAPALADAVYALSKPGVTPVAAETEPDRFYVAQVTERQPDELVTLDTVMLSRFDVAAPAQESTDEDLRKHYEANQEKFRVPEQVQAEYLAVTYADLAKAVATTDDELRKEYGRSVAAGELYCRDWSAAGQPAFLPFEKAKLNVQRRVQKLKAQPQADKLLADALKEFRAQGAKAGFKAYAAKHPGFVTGESGPLDREKRGLEPIGPAPSLATRAFAAAKGDLVGPIPGADGACILRILDRKASVVPPYEDVRIQVEMDIQRAQDVARAVASATKLHEKLVAALADAKGSKRRDAFRKAVENAPITVEAPRTVSAVLSRPVYPPGAGWGKSSFVTGLGAKDDLVRAIFRERPSHLTPPVEDAEALACYVAIPVRFVAPEKPTMADLAETQYRLSDLTRRMATYTWRLYLDKQIEKP